MSYNIIDLFSGAGGLSYGFESAGFQVSLAVEKDAWAVDTYRENHINNNIIEADINELDSNFFAKYKNNIDVVMGGPPCQGFSISASNRRKKDDSRNVLYKQFLRVVSVVQPKIVLIENVKEIENYLLPDGTRIVDDIESFLKNHNYICDYAVLNCRYYGVPQDRKRFFLLAIKNNIIKNDFNLEKLMEPFIKPEITLNEAIDDLPIVRPKQFKEDATMPYIVNAKNEYQKLMRKGNELLYNHIPMQHTDKTIQRFEYILTNGGSLLPDNLLPRVRGDINTVSQATYGQNHRILNGEKVSPTITASFYSSFIHPSQPRNITVREAARVQSFPDSFIFKGKKTTLSKKLLKRKGIVEELHLDQFNQVGNAVPPIMAQCLAAICIDILKEGL